MEKVVCIVAWALLMTLVYSQTTSSGLPPQAQLLSIINGSFSNVDTDHDGFIEQYEFDTIVIIADSDNNGCMTEDEYVHFSAGTPTIARAIYEHFDLNKTNCLTVDKVADQFTVMDMDIDGKVTPNEFEDYYIDLLALLFPSSRR